MTPAEMAATHAAAFSRSRPWSTSEFAELVDQQFCHVVGDARSFALIRVIIDEAELLTVATHPDFQRRGLARACMVQWGELASSLGAWHAFLEVAADNASALSLYAACGFKHSGLRRQYYSRAGESAVDAILMERGLP